MNTYMLQYRLFIHSLFDEWKVRSHKDKRCNKAICKHFTRICKRQLVCFDWVVDDKWLLLT